MKGIRFKLKNGLDVTAPLEVWVLALMQVIGDDKVAEVVTKADAIVKGQQANVTVVERDPFIVTPPQGDPWKIAVPDGAPGVVVPPGVRIS